MTSKEAGCGALCLRNINQLSSELLVVGGTKRSNFASMEFCNDIFSCGCCVLCVCC